MKIVRVHYTTRAAYAAANQENIRQIVNELKRIKHPGIKYSAFLLADGKTFLHLDQFENEEAHQFYSRSTLLKNSAISYGPASLK